MGIDTYTLRILNIFFWKNKVGEEIEDLHVNKLEKKSKERSVGNLKGKIDKRKEL